MALYPARYGGTSRNVSALEEDVLTARDVDEATDEDTADEMLDALLDDRDVRADDDLLCGV